MISIILILIGIITITSATNITFVSHSPDIKHDATSITSPTKIRVGGWIPKLDSDLHTNKYGPGEYIVVDYKKHATTFNEFCEKYPTVTLDTYGVVDSKATFGNVGRNKFGKLRFSTKNFQNDHDVHFVDLINVVDQKRNSYYISVNIAMGFKIRGTTLLLVPLVSVSLTNHGTYGKEVLIDWGVTTVRFNRGNP